MKLHQNNYEDINIIDDLGNDFVSINYQKFKHSHIITAKTIKSLAELKHIEQLQKHHIDTILALKPEIILIGTGDIQQFPEIALLTDIATNNIGLEIMNNQSVARTYNILLAEDRKVACLLILD